MLIVILKWDVLLIPFIEGIGNTTFRWIVEIAIFAVLLLSIVLLIKNKQKLHENISLFLLFSVIIFILSELCFTFYLNTTTLVNVTGYILRLLSYYLIYKAIIQTTLENPYNVLFYRLTEINSSLEIKTRLLMKINKKLNEEIIERKEVEESLRLSKKKYQELLDFLPSAIITHSEGKIVYLNSIALKLLNLNSYKEALERDVLDFIHPDYRTLVDERVSKVYNNHEGDIIELKMLSNEGRELDVETKSVPYIYNEKPAVLVIIGDISERKKAQEKDKALKEAMEYDRIKNEFMANISHEFRTPLNVIFGAIQLIEYYSNNNSFVDNKENISKYSKSMRQNCYRMLRLVNNLIDLTKLDSGFLKLKLQNHNIINIVEDITLSVAQYIESKNINIEFDTDVEEKYLSCDADMIERVMLNLLSNAVKFTPPAGSICVNIYDRGGFILISVKDSGIGIPGDMLETIFDRFRQVDKTLTRNTEGSGIGLNLVKSLVELHGGEIWAESKCGQGSEFIVELPVRTVPWDEVAATIDMPQGKVERIHIEFSDIYS
jgi:PAS domain S-box-containing protein